MTDDSNSGVLRTVREWTLRSGHPYDNPFADVTLTAEFTSPAGRGYTVPGFYDGDHTWRVRFSPDQPGRWTYRTWTRPANAELQEEGAFDVEPGQGRGFLRSTPGQAWGFQYESGEPAFLLGDTVYNLFGMAHCGADVRPFLERRARQGFNLLRVRVPVSPFHPPRGYNTWQTCRTWAWGGSEQAPQFDRFNLEYFATVDTVVRQAEELGIGLEMIMEAWGFEFPFNSRNIFVPEWEELWMGYLIARYDAYSCVYFWTPMNEYEFYPNGDWHYKAAADRWAMRIGRWIKGIAAHGHIVAIHNGPREPAFARRFAADPEAIDTVMFQEWGTRDRDNGWLAAGIEEQIDRSFAGWKGTAVFAEWGYERNPDFELLLPSHEFCDPEHTRRGGWRGAFRGMGVIHGFENSWGPWQLLDEDQPGLAYLLHLQRFFTDILPFHQLEVAPEIVAPADYPRGHRPLALATADRGTIAVYQPVGGPLHLSLPPGSDYDHRWFDPRTGETGAGLPPDEGHAERPHDWIAVMVRRAT